MSRSSCLIVFYWLQEVPEKKKDASGGPWELVGLLPLFDPHRHDSAETIRRALNLGVNVKMITGTNHIVLFFFILVSLHFILIFLKQGTSLQLGKKLVAGLEWVQTCILLLRCSDKRKILPWVRFLLMN